ncbi:hypothetical protein C2E23DRAFT_799656 [Lenzites betulinus]|nr:hypothetical protein C2E23DRAFT_799656 [Lenzites betulinus]
MECLIRTPRYEALRTAGNSIFIVLPTDPARSDADSALAPTQRQPTRDEQGLVNYYDSADEPIDRLWRDKLGRFLYDHVVKEELKQRGIRPRTNPEKVYITNFPANYTLWVHKKGHPHDPRKDHYLYGSRHVPHFRSPMEFCLHLVWLLDGQPMKANGKPNCRCCYCDGSMSQSDISSALGRYHPSKRDRDGKDKDKDGDGKRKPRTKKPAPSTSIPYKDYTKLNTTSAA